MVAAEIPCLVVPPKLELPHSGKDTLQLLNPINYVISFKIKCTHPDHYSVTPATGTLAPNSVVHVLVRRKGRAPPMDAEKTEKLLVEMFDDSRSMSGRQVIPISLASASSGGSPSRASLAHASAAAEAAGGRASGGGAGRRGAGGRAGGATAASAGRGGRSAGCVMLARVVPIAIGAVLVAYLSSSHSDTVFEDRTTALWVAFSIGMGTMLLQLQLMGAI